MIYVISYDLMHDKDYEAIKRVIVDDPPAVDDLHSSHKVLLSVWLVDSSSSVKAWSDHLSGATDKNDRYLIGRLRSSKECWWRAMSGTNAWMADDGRRW